MIPITSKVLRQEVETAHGILGEWLERIDKGIPVMDVPADEEQLEHFVTQFAGELMVVSGKCENIASIIAGNRVA